MNSIVFVWATIIFLGSFLVHVIAWRLLKPKAQIAYLFGIFFFLPLAVYFCLVISYHNRLDLSLAVLLDLAVASVYVQTYPAIQANCPSLFIVHIIGRSKDGLALGSVRQRIEKVGLTSLDARVNDLFNDRLISTSKDDAVHLSLSGKFLALVIVVLRQRILGLKEGEG
jgi:hypothetical protein